MHVIVTIVFGMMALLLGSAAQAADFPVKAVPAAQAEIFNWTGVYIGAHAGFGNVRNGWTDPLGPPFDIGSDTGSGLLAGGQAGVNIQFGHLLVGVEGSASRFNVFSSHPNPFEPLDRLQTTIDRIGYVAGRVGYAQDRWMVYGTAGAAWMGGFHQITEPGVIEAKSDFLRHGFMVGGGGAFALNPNVSVRADVNYFDFGTERLAFVPLELPVIPFPLDIKQTVTVFKVGVDFLVDFQHLLPVR